LAATFDSDPRNCCYISVSDLPFGFHRYFGCMTYFRRDYYTLLCCYFIDKRVNSTDCTFHLLGFDFGNYSAEGRKAPINAATKTNFDYSLIARINCTTFAVVNNHCCSPGSCTFGYYKIEAVVAFVDYTHHIADCTIMVAAVGTAEEAMLGEPEFVELEEMECCQGSFGCLVRGRTVQHYL